MAKAWPAQEAVVRSGALGVRPGAKALLDRTVGICIFVPESFVRNLRELISQSLAQVPGINVPGRGSQPVTDRNWCGSVPTPCPLEGA